MTFSPSKSEEKKNLQNLWNGKLQKKREEKKLFSHFNIALSFFDSIFFSSEGKKIILSSGKISLHTASISIAHFIQEGNISIPSEYLIHPMKLNDFT